MEPRKYKTDEPRDDSVKRAKDKAFEIAYANNFQYFITLTLDKEVIDRYNVDVIKKQLRVWLSNRVSPNDMKYILFAEYHKQKEGESAPAIHFHGLCSGNFKLRDSGHVTQGGQNIYNMENWCFGFSTVVEIYGTYDKAINYYFCN